ncbi:glycosyltransferase [Bosea sp. (in: a-proteobacteria)]
MTRVALLSLSPLRYDSRILRHAALLVGAGYEVRIFAQGPLPDIVPCDVTLLPGPGHDWRVRVGMGLRQAPATIWPQTARLLYWLSWSKLIARRALLQFAPEIVIANDWLALPVAFAAKKSCGAYVVYDSHEFASEEFSDSLQWRAFARRHVKYIERRYIGNVDGVITVSEGISTALAERYSLDKRPTVIFNMPQRQITTFRPSTDQLIVLYHGAIAPRRGLENLIKSVRLWPSRFRLQLRGPVQSQFDQHLKALASPLGDRVTFHSAVAPWELISAASQADIGIFLFSNSTTHAKFALPNKIFEYIQAGLMVISSDLPEIRNLFENTDCGLLLSSNDESSIAEILSALTPETVDKFKHRSVEASQTLNFEHEEAKFLDVIQGLTRRR